MALVEHQLVRILVGPHQGETGEIVWLLLDPNESGDVLVAVGYEIIRYSPTEITSNLNPASTGYLSYNVHVDDETGVVIDPPGANGSLYITVPVEVNLQLSGASPLRVLSELPPSRVSLVAVAPSGRRARWSADSREPGYAPSGLSWSSTAPGGFEQLSVTLPRNPRRDYPDLEPLTTLQVVGASGEVAGEYRLEGAPTTAGDQMAVTPSAVGWQAHLSDDQSHSMVFIDRDLSRWGAVPGLRQSELQAASYTYDQAQAFSGVPSQLIAQWSEMTQSAGWSGRDSEHPVAVRETYYNAGAGNTIHQIKADYDTFMIGTDWVFMLWLSNVSGDTVGSSLNISTHGYTNDIGASLAGSPSGSITLTRPDSSLAWRWALWTMYYTQALARAGQWYGALSNLRVLGNHGLALHGADSESEGLLASDIVRYIIDTFCPMLHADASTIEPSTFIIPHLVFPTPTTAADMITQATRFGVPLPDWFVWEDRTFYLRSRGSRNRKWRARIGPAQLSETGPQIDRLYNAVIVNYQDVDGTARSAGPPGSGCDTETAYLQDQDPGNPLNELGEYTAAPFVRSQPIAMGITATADSAVAVGRAFLEQTALVNRAGEAKIVGHCEDSNGIMYPYWMIRAGDDIRFVDAADTSYRRVVRVQHDDASRTASLTLDAPPDSLQGILERLGVQLVGLGVQ